MQEYFTKTAVAMFVGVFTATLAAGLFELVQPQYVEAKTESEQAACLEKAKTAAERLKCLQ